jgi:hypothetical protein
MSKKIGEELDSDIHFEMLNSFTLFIEHFSPVLDKAETYHKHIVAENLINPSKSNKEKLEIINDTIDTIETMIPIFFKFAKLEDKLEKFHTN